MRGGVLVFFHFVSRPMHVRHRASGTMWSVHRALTCRFLFSCPAEHLIRGNPTPRLTFGGNLACPALPSFLKKNVFFYFPRTHFPDILGLQMDPTWDPKKVPKLFSKVIFGGPRPPPSGAGRVGDFRKKCRMLRAAGPFSRRGGSGAAPGGELFGIPKK